MDKLKWTVIINGTGWREKDHCYDEREVAKFVEKSFLITKIL